MDRVADLSKRTKKAVIRTADAAENVADTSQGTPSEYAGEKLQYGMENIATEAGHIVVDTGKGAYRTGKSAIQRFIDKRKQKEKEQRREQQEQTDAPEVPDDHQAPEGVDPPNSVPKEEVASISSDGNSVVDIPIADESIAPTSNTRQRPVDRTPIMPREGAVSPVDIDSGTVSDRRIKTPEITARNAQSIKTVERTERTIKQSARSAGQASVKSAERSVKGTKKAVKTAEQSSKVAVKTAQESAKAAQRSAQMTAKGAEKTAQVVRAAAKATAEAAKAAAKAVAAAVKAIIAATKELIAAIAAGGWVAVVIIVVLCLIALLVGSCFGIFFSSEDTGGTHTMQQVVQEINNEYLAQIDAIQASVVHDELEMSGARAVWPEVLSVYAVKTTTDPDNPQEVASVTDEKIALLEAIFWAMNEIDYRTDEVTETEIIKTDDGEGNIIEEEVEVTKTYLYITVSHKTAEEMASEYNFNSDQLEQLEALLADENNSMWTAVLYGISSTDDQIVAVAMSQIGNVGGQPYWSWYGFTSRVEWCACFVSWCANECGYIDTGVIPKFAGCVNGVSWFQSRGQWADNSAEPTPGMIIFFDWDSPDGSSGPQDGLSDHVGIVKCVENGRVYTIEGNSGDSCRERSYPLGHYEILGYGIPAY